MVWPQALRASQAVAKASVKFSTGKTRPTSSGFPISSPPRKFTRKQTAAAGTLHRQGSSKNIAARTPFESQIAATPDSPFDRARLNNVAATKVTVRLRVKIRSREGLASIEGPYEAAR